MFTRCVGRVTNRKLREKKAERERGREREREKSRRRGRGRDQTGARRAVVWVPWGFFLFFSDTGLHCEPCNHGRRERKPNHLVKLAKELATYHPRFSQTSACRVNSTFDYGKEPGLV